MLPKASLVIAALAVAGCAPAAARAPEAETRLADDVTVRRIAPGLWVHTTTATTRSFGTVPANGMLLETEDGSLLVDTGWDERQGQLLLDWASRTLGKPVRRAVGSTHSPAPRAQRTRAASSWRIS